MTHTLQKELPALVESNLDLYKLAANTVRTLAIDGVEKATCGHPGMPMGMADAAIVLWFRHLKHNPGDPQWPDRDRFVLSAGHGSMLLYSLLHLSGYDLPMSELQNFRQWNSSTPGHPEYGHAPGVETTTGPLGQGISNAVGMALAVKLLAEKFNRPDYDIVDHYTYVIASDGDLMEGVSHESCALAGHLGLGKLIVLYDDNNISIDGSTDLSFSEDVLKRFDAYGWHTQKIDGHDMVAVEDALDAAKAENTRPSIIACKTTIGFGSPNRAGTSKAHGEALGREEVRLTKEALGWAEDAHFYVPEEMAEFKHQSLENGEANQAKWKALFESYQANFPELAAEFRQMIKGDLPDGWDANLPEFSPGTSMATRKASGAVLNAIFSRIPQLIGGSADLTPSNNTLPKNEIAVNKADFSGRYIHYGVREHGMAAIMSGMALHGGVVPYAGTFLVFSDYMRPSIRLAALMGIQIIYVFTHDSIGLGEDGPTHQPIEHITALRAIPNLTVIRPGDAAETVEAWKSALLNKGGPTALVLTRQSLPVFDRETEQLAAASGASKGAYAIVKQQTPDVLLIATGSELQLVLAAEKQLREKGVSAQVVSMPSDRIFDCQDEDYRESVLPRKIKARVAIEAGATLGWHKYVGDYGEIIGIDKFGASAPFKEIYENYGLTAEAVVEAAIKSLRNVENGQD